MGSFTRHEQSPGGTATRPPGEQDPRHDFLGRHRDGGAASAVQSVPPPLLRKAQQVFGLDFSRVRIHTHSPLPRRLDALAVARGERIDLAQPLERLPTAGRDFLIGHELAHLAQQRLGRVRPTGTAAGVAVNAERALEHEANHLARTMLTAPDALQPALLRPNGPSAPAAGTVPVAQCLKLDLDPKGIVTHGWDLYEAARRTPSPDRLQKIADRRPAIRDWLERLPDTVAPGDAELDRGNLDTFRRYSRSAEALWQSIDRLLARRHDPRAEADTYADWAAGKGRPFPGEHAQHAPGQARYHIDLFGEGHYPGAINITAARRTTTTGVPGSRVPNLIHRRFSGKAPNHIPIADHTADLVTAENGPLDRPALLEEIARIVAPGGTVVLLGSATDEALHDRLRARVAGRISKYRRVNAAGVKILESVIRVPPP